MTQPISLASKVLFHRQKRTQRTGRIRGHHRTQKTGSSFDPPSVKQSKWLDTKGQWAMLTCKPLAYAYGATAGGEWNVRVTWVLGTGFISGVWAARPNACLPSAMPLSDAPQKAGVLNETTPVPTFQWYPHLFYLVPLGLNEGNNDQFPHSTWNGPTTQM